MTTRHIVSYDDITLPYDSSGARQVGRPPTKKRKKNNQKAKQVDAPCHTRHVIEYDGESRELTHEEIWDDSALVDAWEAAQQEYEMYHGTGKNWKDEPVNKSSLWYNVPFEQTAEKQNGVPTTQLSASVAQSDDIEAAEPNSQPLDFDTFVPTHDPSLHLPAVDPLNYVLSTPAGPLVSQDESFSRAMIAMYWGGYWTAMYHCQRHLSNPTAHDAGENEVNEAEAEDGTKEES